MEHCQSNFCKNHLNGLIRGILAGQDSRETCCYMREREVCFIAKEGSRVDIDKRVKAGSRNDQMNQRDTKGERERRGKEK